MELDNNNEEQPRMVHPRSLECKEGVHLRFINLTNKIIELFWIGYTGEYVRYQLLRHRAYLDVDTYKTHPWVAVAVDTKDRMLLDKQYLYMPKTTREHLKEAQAHGRPDAHLFYPITPQDRRKLVYITLPLYSLRYRTLLEMRKFFKTEDEVDALELPASLAEDLKNVVRLRNRRISLPVITAQAPNAPQ